MPQTSPLNWMILSIVPMLLVKMMSLSVLYFENSNNNETKMNIKKNMLWMW